MLNLVECGGLLDSVATIDNPFLMAEKTPQKCPGGLDE